MKCEIEMVKTNTLPVLRPLAFTLFKCERNGLWKFTGIENLRSMTLPVGGDHNMTTVVQGEVRLSARTLVLQGNISASIS